MVSRLQEKSSFPKCSVELSVLGLVLWGSLHQNEEGLGGQRWGRVWRKGLGYRCGGTSHGLTELSVDVSRREVTQCRWDRGSREQPRRPS